MRYREDVKQSALEWIRTHGPAPTHIRMAAMAGKSKRILELGCATGYVSQLLRQNRCTVTGIEIDADAAMEARKICDDVIVGDVSESSVLDRAGTGYDVILCGDVLEHLCEPGLILEQFHGMLAPDGFVLVSIPNIAYWEMRWSLLRGRFEYTETGILDWTHLRFFTVDSFRRLAVACGYRISETVINDTGFPGSNLLRRIPGMKKPIDAVSFRLARLWPNLFSFHSIYKLIPCQG